MARSTSRIRSWLSRTVSIARSTATAILGATQDSLDTRQLYLLVTLTQGSPWWTAVPRAEHSPEDRRLRHRVAEKVDLTQQRVGTGGQVVHRGGDHPVRGHLDVRPGGRAGAQ